MVGVPMVHAGALYTCTSVGLYVKYSGQHQKSGAQVIGVALHCRIVSFCMLLCDCRPAKRVLSLALHATVKRGWVAVSFMHLLSRGVV